MNRRSGNFAHVDMRGFKYALIPFVQKQVWHMESLQRQLSKAQSALLQAQEELKTIQAELEAQSGQVQQALARRLDPIAHQRGLEYLVRLVHRIEDQQRVIDKLRAEKLRIQSECLIQQRKLDGLSEHRAQAQHDFAIEQNRLAAAEADRDWIGRMKLSTREYGNGGSVS